MKQNITIYTSHHCPACIKAKEYFETLDLSYVEKNIDLQKQFRDEMAQLGSDSLPTLIVNGKVIVGFSKMRIDRALNMM